MREVRLALRFLLKKPGWAAAAVLTVAIGVAGSTLAFSLVDRALWRPLGLAAMLAAFGPARRAARVDPASVLRAE